MFSLDAGPGERAFSLLCFGIIDNDVYDLTGVEV
jgi:hypothetical protein